MKFYEDGEERTWMIVGVKIALAQSPINSEISDEEIERLSNKTADMLKQLEKDGRLTVVSVNTGEHYNFTCKGN